MAGRLIGAWNPAEDSAGAAMSGATLTTYVAGTTTNKATYPSSADATGLTNALTNPVVADSAGRFPEIWAPDGAVYDLLWKTSGGVVVKLFEDVVALGSATSGAVTRDFGADGRFNIEARGGTAYLEAGDASPDNTGGTWRFGGWGGTQADLITIDAASVVFTGAASGLAPRGGIANLTLSTAGASATFGIAAGQATDSTGAVLLTLASAMTKTTAAWAVGTGLGSLDTGAIANSTWYHAYLIRRPDTAAVDVITTLSASAPALPTGYTQYRRIGAMKTNGSAQWTKFIQNGDEFLWDVTPAADATLTAVGAAGLLLAVTVPLGVKVEAIGRQYWQDGTAGQAYGGVFSPLISAPSLSTSAAHATWSAGASVASASFRARTNTSRQVFLLASQAASSCTIIVDGWIDRRGRDD